MTRILTRALDAQRRAECARNDLLLNERTRTVIRAARMVTTSAGITIGIAHTPKPPPPGLYAERIQAALLEPRTARPLRGWRALFGLFWRTC